MTKLEGEKRLRREIPNYQPVRARSLITVSAPEGIYLRAKGTRTFYLLPWPAAWLKAAQLHADAKRAERKAKKRAKRGR